jgi:hypothetical protein
MPNWPHDNQAELIAFYGNPGNGEVARQLVKVTPPFQMYYEGRPLKTISFHKKAAPALLAALNEIWDHCGKDQATLDREGISHCAGTYNPRKVRGSATKWSNHAFGAAIDLDAEANGLDTKGDMPDWVVAAFKRQGARWGGDYHGRKDPMHFEFCQDADALGLIDLPEGDADKDDLGNDAIQSPPPPHDVAPDAPIPQPFWKRAWTWISGGGFSLGGLGFLYDWRVAAVIAVVALVVFLIVWPTIKRKLEEM